jgi:hypothetical protein
MTAELEKARSCLRVLEAWLQNPVDASPALCAAARDAQELAMLVGDSAQNLELRTDPASAHLVTGLLAACLTEINDETSAELTLDMVVENLGTLAVAYPAVEARLIEVLNSDECLNGLGVEC